MSQDKLVITKIWTRPDTNVAWWETPTEVTKHIQTNFKDTGLLISEIWTESQDTLSLTCEYTFIFDPAIMETWGQDALIAAWKNTRNTYCVQHNITSTLYKFYFVNGTTGEKILITEFPE